MTQNLRLLFRLGRRRTLSATSCQTKIMTLARNRITFAGGCLIHNAAAGLSRGSLCLPHNAQSPNGPSLLTHHHLNILYVRDGLTRPHHSSEPTSKVLGAFRRRRFSAGVRHRRLTSPLMVFLRL